MKSMTIRMSDKDGAALAALATLRRQSLSGCVLSLLDAALHAERQAALESKPKLSSREQAKQDYEIHRPFRRVLLKHCGWSPEFLDGISRDLEYEMFTKQQHAGPDGTDVGSYPLDYDHGEVMAMDNANQPVPKSNPLAPK